MLDQKFQDKLNQLKARYLENVGGEKNLTDKEAAAEYYANLSADEKEQKLIDFLDIYKQKEAIVKENITALKAEDGDAKRIDQLEEFLDGIQTKMMHAEQKLEVLHSGDPANKEKLKRQLAALELKRCKALIAHKDCGKIDEKISQTKALFKKVSH
ncbi:hypothetical protein [Lactococcus termiticola]|uniref:Uncharacterized protein n=1 Tax=Lactococcus termiticola TaxID=2169526 RepID=A0A2R5HDZ7_9LACT|nr:hypothetical protein [Lactococcus termiticola]GBG96046.1 hypothetical protein NtB2_00149 [Lactococcus termiticola]